MRTELKRGATDTSSIACLDLDCSLPDVQLTGIQGRWLSAREFCLGKSTGAWIHPDGRIYDLGARDGGHGSTSREVLGFTGENSVKAAEEAGYIRISTIDCPSPAITIFDPTLISDAQLQVLRTIVRENQELFYSNRARFIVSAENYSHLSICDRVFSPESPGELVRFLRNCQRLGVE